MRIIIYGVGAIGGTLAVRLTQTGHEVIGIARGAQLEAIRQSGLRLRTPEGDHDARFATIIDPTEIDFRPDDVVLLTMKTQDTLPALERLQAAGVYEQAIFCMQNGFANEDFALRRFPNVYGVVVSMPVTFLTPGEVSCFFGPKLGIFDIARRGAGEQTHAAQVSAALESAGFAAFCHDDIAPFKYAKLLVNLTNAIDACLGQQDGREDFIKAARAEARAVYAAAAIEPADMNGREAIADFRQIPGAQAGGSSSAQSLARGAGSIETDYLNGEIALLGRKFGVPTPVNAYFARHAKRMLFAGGGAGTMSVAEAKAALPGIG